MLTKAEYIKILIFLSVISLIIIIQILIAEDLFEISIPIIKSLQEDTFIVTTMGYISKLGSKKFKTFLLSIAFSMCNHYHTFLYALIAYTSMALCAILKINFQQPRPFWLSDDVKALSCEFGYGYPSNHVITTVPAFLIFYEIVFYRFEVDKLLNGKIYWWIGFLIVLFLSIVVGFSRMVLGVHSLDQVTFGIIMGFSLYYLFLYIIDLDLRNPVPYFRVMFSKYYFYKLILIFAIIFTAFLVNIMLLNGSEIQQDIWSERIIRGCGDLPVTTPFFKCLVDVCDFTMFIGIILGTLFDIKYIHGYNKIEDFVDDNISYDKHSRVGRWNHTGILKTILRVIITYIQSTIVFNICVFLFTSLFEENLITQMVTDKMLPMGVVGFCMFAFYRIEFEWLHLANSNLIDK
jgi:membrane-associated phospholipid phosphatase